MNEPANNPYTTTVNGVTAVPVEVPVLDPVIGTPPLRGKIIAVNVTRYATGIPAGTQVTTRLRNGPGGPIIFETAADPLPGAIYIVVLPIPHFQVVAPGDLVVEMLGDAGGAGDRFFTTVEIEGPV